MKGLRILKALQMVVTRAEKKVEMKVVMRLRAEMKAEKMVVMRVD